MNFVVEKSTQQEGSTRAKGVTLPGNFPVPVLAELGTQRPVTVAIMACDRPITGSHPDSDVYQARAREHDKYLYPTGYAADSRGGENNLSGGVVSVASKSRASVASERQAAPPAQNFC